jgi:hypothetical protein
MYAYVNIMKGWLQQQRSRMQLASIKSEFPNQNTERNSLLHYAHDALRKRSLLSCGKYAD